MALPKGEIISAQAVLLPASGQPISPDAQITSRNLAQFEPSPEAVEQASRLFRALGFEVGGMAGISFSITAPVGTFQEVFKARLQRSAAGGIQCLGDQGAAGWELPLGSLPQELARLLQAVTFTPPPDFGPTSY